MGEGIIPVAVATHAGGTDNRSNSRRVGAPLCRNVAPGALVRGKPMRSSDCGTGCLGQCPAD
jgi:hypothetical protein